MIFLDLETTGFDSKKDKIIEFAAVRVDAQFKELGALDFLVNPQAEIPAIVSQITHIFQADTENERPFEERIDEVKAFIGDDVIWGHNIDFDLSFLREYGIAVENKRIDTNELATILLPGRGSYALEVLSTELSIEHQYKHRALGDVLACLDLARILQKNLQEFPQSFFEKIEGVVPKSSAMLLRFLASQKELRAQSRVLGTELREGDRRQESGVRGELGVRSQELGVRKNSISPSLLLTPNSCLLKNSLIQVPDIQTLYQTCFSYLEQDKSVSVSRRYLSYFADVFSKSFPELSVIPPAEYFLSAQKLQQFLVQDHFNDSEAVVLAKIFRNQSLNLPLNYENLTIHWADQPVWEKLQSSVEERRAEIPRMSGPKLFAHDVLIRKEYELSRDDDLLVVDPQEGEFDLILGSNIPESTLIFGLDDEQKRQLVNVLDPLRDWTLEGQEPGQYGKNRLLLVQDLTSMLFSSVQRIMQSHGKTELNAFFNTEISLVRYLSVNQNRELSFVCYAKEYRSIFQEVLPENTSVIGLSAGPNRNFSFFQTFFGLDGKKEIVLPSAHKIQAHMPEFSWLSSKHPDYFVQVKEHLSKMFDEHQGRIFVLCSAKKQIEDLFLYFALEHPSERLFLGNGFAGGKHKTLHALRQNDNAVFFAQADFCDILAQEGIEFEAMMIIKFPFDAPRPVVKSRETLFQRPFDEYAVQKALMNTQKSVYSLSPQHLYCLDTTVYAQWATDFKGFFESL